MVKRRLTGLTGDELARAIDTASSDEELGRRLRRAGRAPLMGRKNRWGTATGRVVGVRLSDDSYSRLVARAEGRGMAVGEYCRVLIEREIMRSHHARPP